MSRFAALVIKTPSGISCDGVSEGGDVTKLVDRFKALKLAGKLSNGDTIADMRLLYDGIGDGVLKRYRRASAVEEAESVKAKRGK